MKRSLKITIVVFVSASLVAIINSCKEAKEPIVPVLTTSEVLSITLTGATSGGNITDAGGSDVTARGVCWSTDENPTIASVKTNDGKGTGSFSSTLSGLTTNTKYYVRAYATNNTGTGFGNEISFITQSRNNISFNPDLTYSTLLDIEGNEYKTIQIGNQTWMAENLRTTKYNDGSSIPVVNDNISWLNLTTAAYCWYDNDISRKDIYGALYNWHTVTSGNLCPAGWHVPKNEEWTVLTAYLGGESVAGGKLKETGTAHWNPNSDATNESGFTALPGGMRGNGGAFKMVTRLLMLPMIIHGTIFQLRPGVQIAISITIRTFTDCFTIGMQFRITGISVQLVGIFLHITNGPHLSHI